MILILGRYGQLAQSLSEMNWDEPLVVLGSDELDFRRPDSIAQILDQKVLQKPRLIFNAAAYTAVDRAETERSDAAAVNNFAVNEVGRWAKGKNTPVIHFSTDYVFPGDGSAPASELTPTGPINFYGQSKLAGEQALLSSGAIAFIFRVSWIVSPFGNNFLKTMLRLGQEKRELKIVADQVGSPMSALAIAELMLRIFRISGNKDLVPGVYNLSSAPFVSWYDFANTIFAHARKLEFPLQIETVHPIPTSEYKTPAARPLNSRMSDEKFRTTFGDELGSWTNHLPILLRRLK